MIKYNKPFDIFAKWYDKAKGKVADLNVITIAGVDSHNMPFLEIGKLKEFKDDSCKIISNSSRISQGSNIAICIYWAELGYQIRIEGRVTLVDGSDIIFDPEAIEFWQNGKHRLHKRNYYTRFKHTKAWELKQLYP